MMAHVCTINYILIIFNLLYTFKKRVGIYNFVKVKKIFEFNNCNIFRTQYEYSATFSTRRHKNCKKYDSALVN